MTTNNLTDNLLSNILKSVLLIDNQTTTSCKSFNPGHPDSDKKILKIPTSNKQQHPENLLILDILIQTKKLKLIVYNKHIL
ncbi:MULTISPECIES: hypothetical protein [Nostocales]|uniref:hypothetical protein n=1 Tax=Nostocales TaxID=1161 RepID=UPI00029B7616|nr:MULTISPECIES: hypothetical protein [Nostocales]AFW95992.1 hypothetical protein ANA_C13317 [Anabaena sp. 90]MTJ40937.1 hypothetical protein [Dolichospermum sp. UHCC 0406]